MLEGQREPKRPAAGTRQINSEAYRIKVEVRTDGWDPWEEVEAKLWERYENDDSFQAKWKRKARQWKASKPKAEAAPGLKRDLAPSETFWQAGWHRGPCSPATLEEAIEKHRQPVRKGVWSKKGIHLAGPITTANRLRKKRSLDCMVNDPHPKGRQLDPLPDLSETCATKTPGWCQEEGAPFLQSLSKIARQVSTSFSRAWTYGTALAEASS